VTGVEYDRDICQQAKDNLKTYGRDKGVEFVCADAEHYEVTEEDCFYFFNPFSEEILQSVLCRITESYYDAPREIKAFFYYPSDEYLSLLMNSTAWMFLDEIDCQDLFAGKNPRERIFIFELV